MAYWGGLSGRKWRRRRRRSGEEGLLSPSCCLHESSFFREFERVVVLIPPSSPPVMETCKTRAWRASGRKCDCLLLLPFLRGQIPRLPSLLNIMWCTEASPNNSTLCVAFSCSAIGWVAVCYSLPPWVRPGLIVGTPFLLTVPFNGLTSITTHNSNISLIFSSKCIVVPAVQTNAYISNHLATEIIFGITYSLSVGWY